MNTCNNHDVILSLPLPPFLFFVFLLYIFYFIIFKIYFYLIFVFSGFFSEKYFSEDVPVVEFMYLVFTRMPGESYRRRLWSLFLYLCYVFPALINSLAG